MILRKIAILGLCMVPSLALATLPLGDKPKTITLEGKSGGRLDGSTWSSDELQGKVHVLVYSNVASKDLNEEANQALKKEAFPRDKFASVAVINMAGSWQPNFMISNALETKQKEYPNTVYVKDLNKILVSEWNLADKSNDIVVFAADGRVIFSVDGKLSQDDIGKMISTIKTEIAKMSPTVPATESTPSGEPQTPQAN